MYGLTLYRLKNTTQHCHRQYVETSKATDALIEKQPQTPPCSKAIVTDMTQLHMVATKEFPCHMSALRHMSFQVCITEKFQIQSFLSQKRKLPLLLNDVYEGHFHHGHKMQEGTYVYSRLQNSQLYVQKGFAFLK